MTVGVNDTQQRQNGGSGNGKNVLLSVVWNVHPAYSRSKLFFIGCVKISTDQEVIGNFIFENSSEFLGGVFYSSQKGEMKALGWQEFGSLTMLFFMSLF